jgi:aminoglycoside 2'-N-acetyltransferase I
MMIRSVGALTPEVVPVGDLGHDERREIIDLCERAFDEDFSRFFEQFPDTIHVLIRDSGGHLLSHAAWVTRWLQPGTLPILPTAYVEAVATDSDHRGSGLGSAVLTRLIDAVSCDGSWSLAALSPADPAFYARLGWEVWRGPLAIRRGEGIEPSPPDEQVMVHRLALTPVGLDLDSLLTAEWREGELW